MALCPCGSDRDFAACCGPYVRRGEPAPTAEALMRSRYTAYVRRDEAYLLRTWHPTTRPASLDLDGPTWLGLDVLATAAGGIGATTGEVTFVAHYEDDDGVPTALRETSRFVKDGDAWLYVDGEVT